MYLADICGFLVSHVTVALLLALSANAQSAAEGKIVFQACAGCHNTKTEARKAGPSLRILFGKVRLINGKRTNEENVTDLILNGYNRMPPYRYNFSNKDFNNLLAYLKTLDARPEVFPPIPPIRGSDEEVLRTGTRLYTDHCESCHQPVAALTKSMAERDQAVEQSTIVPRVRNGHNGMEAKKEDVISDADLFALIAYLKLQ